MHAAMLLALVVSAGVTYRVERLDRHAIAARFDDAQLQILEQLNRADAAHLGRLGVIVIPDLWLEDPLAYSPLPPEYAWIEPHPKALVVEQPWQVFGAYESGRLVRWGAISSGRRASPTPTGSYALNWKSPGRYSTVDPTWFMRWYFNFHNGEGLSFHEYALPGRPASHSCVRLLARDARWLFGWGEPGTPVLILGRYDFDAPPPWRSPEALARGIDLSSNPQ